MASWEPIDIDCDEIADEDDKWDDGLMNDLQKRFEELKQFNKNFNESHDESVKEESSVFIDARRHYIEELTADQIYDKLTILFNNTRKKFGIQKGRPIEPIRNFDNFKLADDGALSYIYKRTVIDLGNINERLKPPSAICKLGVAKLRSVGFTHIMDEDIQSNRMRYV